VGQALPQHNNYYYARRKQTHKHTHTDRRAIYLTFTFGEDSVLSGAEP